MMVEKNWEWRISKFAQFIDFEKVILIEGTSGNYFGDPYYNIPIELVRVIRSKYEHTTTKIIIQGIESSCFEIRSGVRQVSQEHTSWSFWKGDSYVRGRRIKNSGFCS